MKATLQMGDAKTYDLQSKLFRGFSDDSRLAILEALREGPQAVGRIVEATGLSQSNTSNHLRCLSECGLVSAEQRGRFVYYRLSDARIEAMLRLADELLADVGRRIFQCTNYRGSTRANAASGSPAEQRRRRRQ